MTKTSARISTHCPECGKEFEYYRSWPRKYCSRKCSGTNHADNFGKFFRGGRQNLSCEICGKEYSRNQFEIDKTKHHFCSRACFGIYLKQTRTGVLRPELLGERPDLQKRVTKMCEICHKVFQVKQSHAGRRHFCSKTCMARWQRTQTGEKTHNWRGGYDPYYGPNWRQQRRNARHRDNYCCQKCGITEQNLGRQLDVHHIKSFRSFGRKHYLEANSISNLTSLCYKCHRHAELSLSSCG